MSNVDNAQLLRAIAQALISAADTLSQTAAPVTATPPAAPVAPTIPPAAPVAPTIPPAAPATPAIPTPPAAAPAAPPAAAPVAPPATTPAAPPAPHPNAVPTLPPSSDPQTVAAAAAFDAFKMAVRDLCAQHGGNQEPIKHVTVRYGAQQLSGVHPSLYDSFRAEMAYAFANLPGYLEWQSKAKKPDGTLTLASEYPWPMG